MLWQLFGWRRPNQETPTRKGWGFFIGREEKPRSVVRAEPQRGETTSEQRDDGPKGERLWREYSRRLHQSQKPPLRWFFCDRDKY